MTDTDVVNYWLGHSGNGLPPGLIPGAGGTIPSPPFSVIPGTPNGGGTTATVSPAMAAVTGIGPILAGQSSSTLAHTAKTVGFYTFFAVLILIGGFVAIKE